MVPVDPSTLWTGEEIPVPWAIEPFLIENTTTMFVADGGTGKTFLLMHLAMALASGRPAFGGLPVSRPYRVAYIDQELSDWMLYSRIGAIRRGLGLSVAEGQALPLWIYSREQFTFDADMDLLKREVLKNEIDFIFIDPFRSCFDGDENDSGDIEKLFRQVNALKGWRTAPGVVFAHHTTKGKRTTYRGSSAIRGATDQEFLLTGKLHQGLIEGRATKARGTEDLGKFLIRATFGSVERPRARPSILGTAEKILQKVSFQFETSGQPSAPPAEPLLRLLAGVPKGLTRKELEERFKTATGQSERTFRRRLKDAVAAGKIVEVSSEGETRFTLAGR